MKIKFFTLQCPFVPTAYYFLSIVLAPMVTELILVNNNNNYKNNNNNNNNDSRLPVFLNKSFNVDDN